MKPYNLLICICLAMPMLGSAAARISPMATLPDGSQVEIAGHYFMEGEWPTLSIVDSEEPVTWEVRSYEYYWNSGVLGSEPKEVVSCVSPGASSDFELPYQQIKWKRQFLWDDEDDETHSELRVSALVDGETVDQVTLKFRLAPSQLKVLDVTLDNDPAWHITEWCDWENDEGEICSVYPHYVLQVKRAEVITVCWSSDVGIHDFLLKRYPNCNPINIYEGYFPPRVEIEGDIWKFKREVETFWGEWFTFEASNEYGCYILPERLCTTDCITDPDDLAKLRQWYEEEYLIYTKVDDIAAPGEDAPVQYFNLQGMPVAHPRKGELVIRKRGAVTDKIIY